MGDKTGIEWCDATWNAVRGCALVSAGCTNCYAMRQAHRSSGAGRAYAGLTRMTAHGPVWTGAVRTVPELLDQPLRWRRPRRIFVNSMSDLFHEDVPDEFVDQVFAAMALAPHHTFQVLTKRPERMKRYMMHWPDGAARFHHVRSAAFHLLRSLRPQGDTGNWSILDPEMERASAAIDGRWPLPNVWLGVSAEDQRTGDERIPLLLDTPAAVHWLSAEPLLGPMTVEKYMDRGYESGGPQGWIAEPSLNWVVVGGESGPDARPMHPDWVRRLRDQCNAAGVPFLLKQWGEYAYQRRKFGTFQTWVNKAPSWIGGMNAVCVDTSGNVLRNGADFAAARDGGRFPVAIAYRVGKKAAGRELDGRIWDEYPS